MTGTTVFMELNEGVVQGTCTCRSSTHVQNPDGDDSPFSSQYLSCIDIPFQQILHQCLSLAAASQTNYDLGSAGI